MTVAPTNELGRDVVSIGLFDETSSRDTRW
jgi:hypothetical protein